MFYLFLGLSGIMLIILGLAYLQIEMGVGIGLILSGIVLLYVSLEK